MEIRVKRPMLRAGLVLSIIFSLATAVVGGFVGYVLVLLGSLLNGFGGGEQLPWLLMLDLLLFIFMIIISLVVVGLSIAGLIKSSLPLEQFTEKKKIYTAIFSLLFVIAGIIVLFVLLSLINSSKSTEISKDSLLALGVFGTLFVGLIISAILVAISRKGGKVQQIINTTQPTESTQTTPNKQITTQTIESEENTQNQDVIDKAV